MNRSNTITNEYKDNKDDKDDKLLLEYFLGDIFNVQDDVIDNITNEIIYDSNMFNPSTILEASYENLDISLSKNDTNIQSNDIIYNKTSNGNNDNSDEFVCKEENIKSNPSDVPVNGKTSFFPSKITTMNDLINNIPISNKSTNIKEKTDADIKKEIRLQKNRESARASRRRKKQYLELLEEKVIQLTEENHKIRNDHLKNSNKNISELKKKKIISLYQYLEKHEMDKNNLTELVAGIKYIQQHFGADSEERFLVTDYYINQIENLVFPPYVLFLLWLSVQKDHFFSGSKQKTDVSKTLRNRKQNKNDIKSNNIHNNNNNEITCNKNELWSFLCNDLNLSTEQEEKIIYQYKRQTNENSNYMNKKEIDTLINYLNNLSIQIKKHNIMIQNQSNYIINTILTPEQAVKYLYWLENNRDNIIQNIKEENYYIEKNQQNLNDIHEKNKINEILKKPDELVTFDEIQLLFKELDDNKSIQNINYVEDNLIKIET